RQSNATTPSTSPWAASASSPAKSEHWWMKPRWSRTLRKSDLYFVMVVAAVCVGPRPRLGFARRAEHAQEAVHGQDNARNRPHERHLHGRHRRGADRNGWGKPDRAA